jgi:hypothetical protein
LSPKHKNKGNSCTQTTAQLDGAFEYLKKVASEAIAVTALEEAAGVGVEVRSTHGSSWQSSHAP